MTFRFNPFNTQAAKFLMLVPSVLTNEEYRNGIDIGDLITYYSSDLPNADITDQELRLWQRKWSEYSPEFRPTTLAKTIKECNEDRFPNIFVHFASNLLRMREVFLQ